MDCSLELKFYQSNTSILVKYKMVEFQYNTFKSISFVELSAVGSMFVIYFYEKLQTLNNDDGMQREREKPGNVDDFNGVAFEA